MRRIDWREPWLAPGLLPWLLAAIGLAALVLRMAWIHRFGLVIENEGTAFTILARSMREGLGYIGVLGDRHTFVPPLYPFLIRLLEPLAGSEEMAARSIACVAGVVLILPGFSIARRLGGARAGLIAAVLFACHGIMLGFSGAVYIEGPYFCLLFSSMAVMLRAVERGSNGLWIASGLLFGFAYLCRPEAIAYVALAAVFVLWRSWQLRGQQAAPGAARAGLMVLLCAVIVAPYVYWLSATSGHLRLEGKSASNGLVNERIAEGMTFDEAARGLTIDLQPAGPDLIHDQFEIPQPQHSGLKAAMLTVLDAPVSRSAEVMGIWIKDSATGGPLLFVLALMGLIAAFSRNSRNVPVATLFLCMSAGYVGLILSVTWFDWLRYVYPLTFFMIVWGAIGISWCVDLCGAVMERFRATVMWQGIARLALIGVLTGAIVFASLLARHAPLFHESHNDRAVKLREVGEQIREQSTGNPLVMGYSAVTPYYAGGFLRYLPWLPEDKGNDALIYIHQHPPDFIVLRTAEVSTVPYAEQWLERGIPDACAREILRTEDSPGQEVVVYAWECSTGDGLGESPDPVDGEIPAQHRG